MCVVIIYYFMKVDPTRKNTTYIYNKKNINNEYY